MIDEIQRMPELFEVLRPLCDRPRNPAKFLLLGSASPDLVQGVSESLAGRALFVRVPGFAIDELGKEWQNRLWLRGGFPRACLASGDDSACRWMERSQIAWGLARCRLDSGPRHHSFYPPLNQYSSLIFRRESNARLQA